jgi:acyl carrier protein
VEAIRISDIDLAPCLAQGEWLKCRAGAGLNWTPHSAPSEAWISMRPMSEQETELAELIVTSLNLETVPAEIDPDAPLYAEGIGLDSVDILEIALEISKKYGFQLRSGDDDNVRIFSSLASLNEHVQAHRTL